LPTRVDRVEVEITPSRLTHFKAVLIDGGDVIASAIVVDRDVEDMTIVLYRGRFYHLTRKEKTADTPIWYYHQARLVVVEGPDDPKAEPRAIAAQGKFVRVLPRNDHDATV
jgi:hypothetical protein